MDHLHQVKKAQDSFEIRSKGRAAGFQSQGERIQRALLRFKLKHKKIDDKHEAMSLDESMTLNLYKSDIAREVAVFDRIAAASKEREVVAPEIIEEQLDATGTLATARSMISMLNIA